MCKWSPRVKWRVRGLCCVYFEKGWAMVRETLDGGMTFVEDWKGLISVQGPLGFRAAAGPR